MENESQIWTLGKLAEILGAEIIGSPEFVISAPASSDSDDPSGLAYAEGDDYLEEAKLSGVGAVIVPLTVDNFPKPVLRHAQPRIAFGHLLSLFDKPFSQPRGIHPTAVERPVRNRGLRLRLRRDVRAFHRSTVRASAEPGNGCS